MLQVIHEITQTGNVLLCDKIVINKYENKITKLHFNYDNTIQESRKYIALLNPVTDKYRIHPVGLDDSVLLNTDMSMYPGVWRMLLIATSDDYIIIDDNIDNSKCTYVSNECKKIIVRDNFLSEGSIEYEDNPAIQQLIDETVAMRDTLETYALGANEDYNKATVAAQEAQLAYTSAKEQAEIANNAADLAVSTQKSVAQMSENLESSVKNIQTLLNNVTADGDGTKFLSDDGNYYAIKTDIDETDFSTMLEEVFV